MNFKQTETEIIIPKTFLLDTIIGAKALKYQAQDDMNVNKDDNTAIAIFYKVVGQLDLLETIMGLVASDLYKKMKK